MIAPVCTGLVLLVAVLAFSCGKEKAPQNLLPQDKVVNVLSDLYVVEQKVNALALKRDTSEQIFAKLKDKVFEKNGVTDSSFRVSLDYYVDRPGVIEGIYSQLVDSLNLREQRILSGQHPQ
nr:DUF4296 domain-containing protein [Chryseolinea lacunae]